MDKKKEIFIVQDTNIEKRKRGRVNRRYLYEKQTSNKTILNEKVIYGTNIRVKKRGVTLGYDRMVLVNTNNMKMISVQLVRNNIQPLILYQQRGRASYENIWLTFICRFGTFHCRNFFIIPNTNQNYKNRFHSKYTQFITNKYSTRL